MGDISKLIDTIVSTMKGKVYTDEPIVMRASQMQSYVPPELAEMRRFISAGSVAAVFCAQGKFLENYEDDFDCKGEFMRYFPTYQSMSVPQLRGYFTWRTRVRRGDIRQTSLSFAFIYMYELINLIGVSSPTDAYDRLRSFGEAYGALDVRINSYLRLWLGDMAVYYGIDRPLPASADADTGDRVRVLINCAAASDIDVFTSLAELSSYNIKNSKFYKTRPDIAVAAVSGIYRALDRYYDANRRRSLSETLFGKICTSTYYMFSSAVFHEREKHADCEVRTGCMCCYTCKNGVWSCERLVPYADRSGRSGDLLRYVDSVLREMYGFGAPLKRKQMPAYAEHIVAEVIGGMVEAEKEKARPRIEIDLSKLDGIREAALKTQEKLTVDEDEEPAPPAAEEPPSVDSPLNAAETEFLSCLLYGRPYESAVKASGLPLSVLAEAVNSKLFERFGDTVIDFDGDAPELIPDYIDDLKGTVKR